jgi:hypothetical protein
MFRGGRDAARRDGQPADHSGGVEDRPKGLGDDDPPAPSPSGELVKFAAGFPLALPSAAGDTGADRPGDPGDTR